MILVLRRSAAASLPTSRAMRAAAHAAPRLRSEGTNAAVGAADCWRSAAGAADAPRAEGAAAGIVPCGCWRNTVLRCGACPAAGEGDRGCPAAAAGLEGGRHTHTQYYCIARLRTQKAKTKKQIRNLKL